MNGDSIRTVALPKGTIINDLVEKGGEIFSVGLDVVGARYDQTAHLLAPIRESSATATIKKIDFDSPIDTQTDVSLEQIYIGNDSYSSNSTCSHPLSSITNMAKVFWKDIELEIKNTGSLPIHTFAVKGDFDRECSFFCSGFVYEEMVNLTENPIEVGATYIHRIPSFETPNKIRSQENEYEFCLWLDNINSTQDMNPDNNYYCGTFPVLSSTQNIESTQIDIFPNPAHQYVSIQMNEENTDLKQVFIYNMQGQLKKQTTFREANFDIKVEDLLSGTYYINIQSPKRTFSKKLIVLND